MSYVVAVAGGSASGKSTFAVALQAAIQESASTERIEILSMDRFMRRDDPEAPHFDLKFSGSREFNANHPESVDNAQVLRAINESTAQVILLEGLMAFAVPELRERADLRIFIDLEADVRAIRRIERDIRIGRSGGNPPFIAAYYIECARVGHEMYVEPSKVHADLIVRGDGDFPRISRFVAKIITACA